jgi:hypothetical protein
MRMDLPTLLTHCLMQASCSMMPGTATSWHAFSCKNIRCLKSTAVQKNETKISWRGYPQQQKVADRTIRKNPEPLGTMPPPTPKAPEPSGTIPKPAMYPRTSEPTSKPLPECLEPPGISPNQPERAPEAARNLYLVWDPLLTQPSS